MRALIVGQGELGWRTLQILAMRGAFDSLYAWDVDSEKKGRVSIVSHASHLLGGGLDIRFERVDLFNHQDVAERLHRGRPDVIVNSASLQSWWVITQLPTEVWKHLHSAGFGIWLPAHLAPAFALMRAVVEATPGTPVVNMAFPDATNVALSRVGLAPTLGAGNVEELVPILKHATASKLGVEKKNLRVWLFAHHWVNSAVLEDRNRENLPLICRIFVGNQDVTDQLDIPTLLIEGSEDFPSGAEDTWLIAASAAHKAEALVREQPTLGHAAGPAGLPGGYPVVVSNGSIGLDMPPSVPLERCIAVNEEGAYRDGIQEITKSGEVVLRHESSAIMRELLGWAPDRFTVEDALPLARELVGRYQDFAGKFNSN